MVNIKAGQEKKPRETRSKIEFMFISHKVFDCELSLRDEYLWSVSAFSSTASQSVMHR